jgi:acyl homoserine lactone synthase
MIKLIQGAERSRYPHLIDAMYRTRADVFGGRHGWDVDVKDGIEVDMFDDVNPLYLIAVSDDEKTFYGSLRLLPTTGPNMLRDVFSCLLPDGEVIESATIWESTRFCVHPSALVERSANRLNKVTGELLAGAIEVGLLAGLTEIVSVFDARMARVLSTGGCPAEIIGTPVRIGRVMTYAGLFDVSDKRLDNIRQASGIVGSVLEGHNLVTQIAA